jgi:hypothetical protein
MHDHIDFVVSQWDSAMPELDASSMKVFGRMLRVMKHLGRCAPRRWNRSAFAMGI